MATALQFNYRLFQDINSYAGHLAWLDALMIFCANTLIYLWPLVLLILWGRPLSWRKRPLRSGEAEMVRECRAVVLWTGVACLIAYGLNLLIEQVMFEPRPFVAHTVHLLVAHTADDSFPSDHTAWSFAIFGMLLFLFLPIFMATWRKRAEWRRGGSTYILLPLLLIVVALTIACSIGLARVFVGVHYPGDIVGGAFDGLVAAGIVTQIRHWLRKPTDAVLGFAQGLHLA